MDLNVIWGVKFSPIFLLKVDKVNIFYFCKYWRKSLKSVQTWKTFNNLISSGPDIRIIALCAMITSKVGILYVIDDLSKVLKRHFCLYCVFHNERFKSICLLLQLGSISWAKIGGKFSLIPGHFIISSREY